MKKLILLALVCAMAGACSKDSDSEDRLRKATVKGAVMAYQSAGRVRGARTGSDFSGFNTVDAAGNVKPIRFITDRGDTLDMQISAVKSLSERYMLLKGSFHKPQDLRFYYNTLLVDVNTEYIYAIEGVKNLYEDLPVFSDDYGCWYFVSSGTVVKLNASNPDNLTVESCLAEGQSANRYWVSADGVIYYEYGLNSKFKCPGGRTYTFEELLGVSSASVFCGHSGVFYAAAGDIYKISLQGPNILQAQVVWESDLETWNSVYAPYDKVYCPNPKRKEHIAVNNNSLYVFNEELNEMRKIEQSESIPFIREYCGWESASWTNAFVTSESLFIFDESYKKLYQISLADYSVHTIDMVQAGYEITPTTLSCNLTSPGLSFAGLRYADGKNVVGMINEDGSIMANERTATDTPIVSLVRLN